MMNRKTTFFLIAITFLLFPGFAKAQFSFRIDSVAVVPTHPTNNDEVVVIAYTHASHGSCLMLDSSIVVSGNTIEIEGQYNTPGYTVECDARYTFKIGKLCPGQYNLIFRPWAMVPGCKAVGNPPVMVMGIFKTYLDTAVVSFNVAGNPGSYAINLPEEISLCENEVKLDAGNFPGISYLWNTGETTQQIHVTESGRYTVTLLKGHCEEDWDTCVVNSGCELFFPNTFTPNGDGINDIFAAKGIDIKKFEINIYNRWGEKIAASTNVDRCWNGKLGNNDAPQGVYLWQASYISSDSDLRPINRIGRINLLR